MTSSSAESKSKPIVISCASSGWTLAKTGHDPVERRVVSRLAMSIDAAREIWADLADALRQEGGYGERRPEVAAAQFRDRALDN